MNARAATAVHPLDHMVPDACYDCHSFAGPIAGCHCPGCTSMRGHHPERKLRAGRLVAVDGSLDAIIPNPAEIAAHQADQPVDRPSGDGTGHGTADGPSEKQLAYLARLADERGVPVPTVTSRKAASREIDRLQMLPRVERTVDVEGPVGRFERNRSGIWAVRLTSGTARPGDTVTVVGRTETKPVKVGTLRVDGLFDIVEDRPVPAAPVAPPTACPEGIHRSADGTVFKVYRTQTSGKLAAKRLVVHHHGDGQAHGEFVYAPGAIRKASLCEATRLPHDEAARFGQLYGWCIACGRDLDTEESLSAGYGPKCARNNGWPWGRKQRIAVDQATTGAS